MSGNFKKGGAGVRVAHDFDDFMEDRDLVLTLKDTYILNNQDVDEGMDVLENIDMAERYKEKANIDNRTKKTDLLEGKYGGEKKMLAQYDEKPTEKEGIVLDTLGEYNLEKIKALESIKNKLVNPNKKGGEISLETTKNIASEYYTSEEMKKFKKPVKKAANAQKNKEDILKFLEDSLGENDGDDHGSRNARQARERADLNDQTQKKLKTENYEAALQKARDLTKHSAMIDEEYEGIQRAIENQRRAAQKGRTNNVEDVVRTLIESSKPVNSVDNNDVVILNGTTKKPADAEFVELDSINTTTNFLGTVTTKETFADPKAKTNKANLDIKSTKGGTVSVVNVSLPSEKLLASFKAQVQAEQELNKPAAKKDAIAEESEDIYSKEEIEKLKEETEFITEETLSGGMLAALKAAREKGLFMENETEVVGRHKDKTYTEELAKFGPSATTGDVKLEYRDKNGRLMTPKEAFRYQCRIFHNMYQSKTKQQKERNRFEAEKKKLSVNPQESGSMKALAKIQQQTNQAYAVLDTKKGNK